MNIQVKYITIKYIAHSSKLQPYSIVKDANGLRLDDEIWHGLQNGFHIDQATRRRVYADVYCRKIR